VYFAKYLKRLKIQTNVKSDGVLALFLDDDGSLTALKTAVSVFIGGGVEYSTSGGFKKQFLTIVAPGLGRCHTQEG
jgi:hypothetical protein